MKERHFDFWFTETKRQHDVEEAALRKTFYDREKKASLSGPTVASVKAKNDDEWKRFDNRRSVQLEVRRWCMIYFKTQPRLLHHPCPTPFFPADRLL